jgi:hypothetical protein
MCLRDLAVGVGEVIVSKPLTPLADAKRHVVAPTSVGLIFLVRLVAHTCFSACRHRCLTVPNQVAFDFLCNSDGNRRS